MRLKRQLIEGAFIVLVSAIVIPIGVWISDEPGMLLLLTYYPSALLQFLLDPAIPAAIIGAVISIFTRDKKAFWPVFRPVYFICWGFLTIRFLIGMMMN